MFFNHTYLKFWFAAITILFNSSNLFSQDDPPPNILFVAVDDLNCDFGAYGNQTVKSPTLDQIAAEGVLFTNNHCQKAVCGASRASVLSGFTPEHTGITGFRQYLRDMYPEVITLPLFFKNNGYETVGMGKIHDPRNVSETDEVDLISWTRWIDIAGNQYVTSTDKPVTEAADVDDDEYTDGRLANEGVKQIQELANNDQPFFLAVGFKKPHLPFAAPKKYWDLYDQDSISLAAYRKYATDDLEFVHNPGSEFRNGYDHVPAEGNFPYDLQRHYIHGYYACISYIDKQIEKLIQELKAQDIYNNTIIVIWGDHGFSLGDHTNWGKHTNFEHATRCPLIIKAAGSQQGYTCDSPTELLDVYPTLADLAGFNIPDTLDGTSLKPILEGTNNQVKTFSVSQFSRGGKKGFSMRSKYYQYVEWLDDDIIAHQQLFNFVNDPYQTQNLYLQSTYTSIIDTFSYRLNRYFTEGENTDPILLTADTDSLQKYRVEHQLSFSVYGLYKDQSTPIQDASITINPLMVPTSKKGYADLNLQEGNYTYSIEKEGYEMVSDTISLVNDSTIEVSLKRNAFNTSFQVNDMYSGRPLIGVNIKLGSQSGITDTQGKVVISTKLGEYELSVIKDHYAMIEKSYSVSDDSTLILLMKPTSADIKVRLENDGVPINNATVTINDTLQQITNAIGFANFYDLEVDQEYHYEVKKENYITLNGLIFLRTDTSLSLNIGIESFAVNFLVTSSNNSSPLEGVIIQLGDSTKNTLNDGKVIFSNYQKGYYQCVINKEGYAEQQDSLEITVDTTISIVLLINSLYDKNTSSSLNFSPVPATDLLQYQGITNIDKAILINSTGKTILVIQHLKQNDMIDLRSYASGIYFILARLQGEAQYIAKKIIKE